MGKGGGSKPKAATVMEPVKAAEQVQKGASAATMRAQQIRQGLASTFSRSTMGAGVSATSATAGAAKKLGG